MSRKARISGIFGPLSEEVQTGCIVRGPRPGLRARRQADFHHGLLGLFLAATTVAQEGAPLPEGNAYLRRVLQSQSPQDGAINDYSYDLEETKENLDKKGIATSRETRVFQVYFVDTRPVRRLVSRNGIRLSPKEQAAVDRKAEEKAKAISEGRTASEQPGVRLSGLVDSLEFTTLGREERGGRKTLVFDFKPRKDGKTQTGSGRAADAVARILTGRAHIDEADQRVVLLDARNAPGKKASVATGVKVATFELLMEFVRVEGPVWLPQRVVTLATGRAFLFKTFRVRQTTTYSNYLRFKVDTEERAVR